MSVPNSVALLWDVVWEVLVVKPDEEFIELITLVRQVPNDLVEEPWVIAERMRYWVDLLLCLEISAYSALILPDKVMKLECEREYLAYRDSKSVVWPIQERFGQDPV